LQEDEKEHRRFCRDRQRGITVPKWKNERQLKSFAEHDGTLALWRRFVQPSSELTHCLLSIARIIEIRKDDAPLHVKKLMEVKEVLDDAFGFVEKDEFLERGHFLFVQAKQIVGCVTVERIAKATVLEQLAKNPTPSSTEPSSPGSPRESSQEVPAVLGICQLWVHPEHRGKKIATRLIDVVREKYIYGLLIAKHRIAFAQPTRNGLAFAKAYVTSHRVLVYGATLPNSPTAPSSSSTAPTSSVKRTLLH
jgi:N-acetyltransferase